MKDIIDTKHKNPFNFMSIGTTLNARKERQTILKTIRKPELVHGSYAFNRQVKYPVYQKRPFTDVDIKSPTMRQTALDIEKNLDNMANMNNYYVSKLNYGKYGKSVTYRVHSRSRKDVVADVGELKDKIPTVTIDGVPYETISHRRQAIQRLLDDPESKYRREKDKRMMGYIDRYQKQILRKK